MSELLDFYRQQAEENLSDIPWVAELQVKSWHELSSRGFPTRSNEDWKYTRVEELLQQRFPFSLPKAEDSIDIERIFSSHSNCPIPSKTTLYNGQLLQKNALPPGVILLPISESLSSHEDLVKPFFDKLLAHEQGFHSLNTTLFNAGIFLYIPPNVRVEDPIAISHYQDIEQSLQVRHLIILGNNSEATIVEDYYGENNCAYFTNAISEIYVGKQAKFAHYKVQRESKKSFHIGHVSVSQAEGSEFENHAINLGGKLVRNDVTINLQEENSHCLLNGIYIPGQAQHIDQQTKINHHVPRCSSKQDYKGILGNKARAIFNGKIVVDKHAQQTEALQSNKNILLSPDAEVDTKPQLEIFADDITCSHGATVGQLEEEALFYLRARGIEPDEANRYLIHAFVTMNLNLISPPILANWINGLIDQQLEQLDRNQ